MDSSLWLLDENQILEEVDEYLLYSHYLGFQPDTRMKYRSPVRPDNNPDSTPSFGVFQARKFRNREYAWKDQATGDYGDIYELVQKMYKFRSRTEAIAQVRSDFILKDNPSAVGFLPPIHPPPSHIRIKSIPFSALDFKWWDQWGILYRGLKKYNTTRFNTYFLTDLQPTPSYATDLAYAYRIYNHYQLHFPERSKDRRFRNDFNDTHLPGYLQLRYESDTLIVSKGFKDLILWDELGYEVVAQRGEHTMIPEPFLEKLIPRYKRIILFLDNDGKHNAHKYWEQGYPFQLSEIPIETHTKDLTDHHRQYGRDKTIRLLKELL